MGFTPPRKVYVLDFEGTELHGLEVRARGATIGTVLALGGLVDSYGGVPDPEDVASMSEEQQAKLAAGGLGTMRQIIDTFASVLVSWNYEDESGQAVPANADGMLTLDASHLMMIIRAWQHEVVAVPPASSPTSNDGAPSVVASLPMAPLSENRAS